jgi:hypothetical protein
MSTLAEIEAAVEGLTPREWRERLRFLAARPSMCGTPVPREFAKEQMAAWVMEDEADMRRFNEEA